jgi:hypothetical protein
MDGYGFYGLFLLKPTNLVSRLPALRVATMKLWKKMRLEHCGALHFTSFFISDWLCVCTVCIQYVYIYTYVYTCTSVLVPQTHNHSVSVTFSPFK